MPQNIALIKSKRGHNTGGPQKVYLRLSKQKSKSHSLKQAKMNAEQLKICPPHTHSEAGHLK